MFPTVERLKTLIASNQCSFAAEPILSTEAIHVNKVLTRIDEMTSKYGEYRSILLNLDAKGDIKLPPVEEIRELDELVGDTTILVAIGNLAPPLASVDASTLDFVNARVRGDTRTPSRLVLPLNIETDTREVGVDTPGYEGVRVVTHRNYKDYSDAGLSIYLLHPNDHPFFGESSILIIPEINFIWIPFDREDLTFQISIDTLKTFISLMEIAVAYMVTPLTLDEILAKVAEDSGGGSALIRYYDASYSDTMWHNSEVSLDRVDLLLRNAMKHVRILSMIQMQLVKRTGGPSSDVITAEKLNKNWGDFVKAYPGTILNYDRILFTTPPIFLGLIDMGVFKCEIGLDPGRFSVNINREGGCPSDVDGNHIHPHIHGGTPCFGNWRDSILSHVTKANFIGAARTIIAFLKSYDMNTCYPTEVLSLWNKKRANRPDGTPDVYYDHPNDIPSLVVNGVVMKGKPLPVPELETVTGDPEGLVISIETDLQDVGNELGGRAEV